MYIHVKDGKVEVVEHVVDKEKPKILCTIERVEDELEGFLKYKHMSKTNNKYELPSMQEFQHILLAWDDFVTELYPMLNANEQAEFHKFAKSMANVAITASPM